MGSLWSNSRDARFTSSLLAGMLDSSDATGILNLEDGMPQKGSRLDHVVDTVKDWCLCNECIDN